jgi:hypothetical protein
MQHYGPDSYVNGVGLLQPLMIAIETKFVDESGIRIKIINILAQTGAAR